MDDTSYSAGTPTQYAMLTNGNDPTTRTTADNDVPLIEHETVTRTWTSRGSGKAKLDDIAMSSIGSLCHCRVEWSKESAMDVNIIGDTEQDVVRAISKLSVMDKAAVSNLNTQLRVTDTNGIDRTNELSSYHQLCKLRSRVSCIL